MKIFAMFLTICLCITGCTFDKTQLTVITRDIGFLSDSIGVDDNSLNELAYKGISKAKAELGVEVSINQINERVEYEKNLRKLAEKDLLTVGIGRNMKQEIYKVAMDMKTKNFVIVGEGLDLDNVKSITFKDEEGAFLMGVLAGKYTKTNKIGYIGGKRPEKTQPIETGFALGINMENTNAAAGIINEECIRYTEDYNSEERGYKKAVELITAGCDIIFTDTGKSDLGVFKAAVENNIKVISSEVSCISEFPQYKDVALGSLIKKVDIAIYNACKESVEGNFRSGLNNKVELNLKSGLMDYEINGDIENAFSIDEAIKQYKSKIIMKEIKIPERLISLKNI